jgi:hypothetical protein
VLAVLRRLDVQVPGDLDDLAVYRDHPGCRVNLRDGHGGQLTPAQPAVGGGIGHQLVPLPVPRVGQRLTIPDIRSEEPRARTYRPGTRT